jgi:DNA-binding GntR family transcriptional regulator
MRLSHQSLVARVVEEMEQQILNGQLPPGQRITEESLSKQWEVSRSSLREAFRILESQGFVEHTPRRGVKVTEINPTTVREVYQVRAALEGLTVRLAVESKNSKVLAHLTKLHQRMQEKAAKGDRKQFQELNQQFHEVMIKASQNQYLIQTLTPINKMTMRLRAEVFISPQGMEQSLLNHAELLHSFTSGDAKAAGELRTETVLRFGEILATLLEEKMRLEQAS